MANEDKKDFNAMLRRDNGMPKTQTVTDAATIEKYGGSRMFFAPPKPGAACGSCALCASGRICPFASCEKRCMFFLCGKCMGVPSSHG